MSASEDSLASDVEQRKEEINELKRKVESIETIDMSIKAKIDTTRVALERQERQISNVFVHTRAMKRVFDILDTNRYVVIKGNLGAGKTTIAMHVLTELQKKGMAPLQVTTVQDLYGSVSPFSNVALFLDNLFGEFILSNEIDNFDSKLHLIRAICSNDNTVKGNVLIVTIRSDIYNEAADKRSIGDSFFTNSVVDISNGDFQLQNLEMIEFFTKYGLDKLLKSNTTLDIVKIGNTFGIPQCCRLLKNNPTLSEDIFGFLKDPIQSLEMYLKNILDRKECKTAVLVYILLCGGSVEEKVLQTALQDVPRKNKALEIIGAKNSTLMDFQNSIYHYRDSLMTYDTIEEKYKFSHSSVQESLFKCLVNFYPKEIIKSCDHVLLERLTTCKNLSWNSVVITEEFFQDIIKRLLEMLEEMSISAFRTISRLQIWKDEKILFECEKNQTLLNGIKQNTDSCGQTMLVHFCVSGNIRWVKYLLLSSSQEQRYMSLNEACAHNQKDIVDLILTTDVNYDLKTCFHAVQSGDLDMLYRFTDTVDLNEKTFSNHFRWNQIECGLLHEICFFGQNDLIQPVLARYPHLFDVQNDQGENALHSVAFAGDETIFKNMIKSGCDPYSRSNHGSTVLHYACQNGKLNMVRYICDTFPNLLSPDYNDNEGRSPLHWSAESGNIEVYEYFIEKGVEQTFTDGQSTPLHEACKTGKLDMCKFLVITYPQLIDLKDNNGENALYAAACMGNIELFNFLLGKGFDIETKRNDGKTVLHQCCMNGNLDMCMFLVNTYPHLLDIKDNDGENVLHAAAWEGNIDLLKFLLEKSFDINSTRNDGKNLLHMCCMNGQLDMCKYLVSTHPHLLHVKDTDGNNALHDAASGGNIDLFKFLLEKGFDFKVSANDGKTVLHICCMNGKLDMCKYLVNTYPPLLDAKDDYGGNALHAAAWGGNIDLFTFLLGKGFDIKVNANDGKNVILLCCMNGNLEMFKYLVNKYPHLLYIKDTDGNNALHAAAWGGNIDLFKFLLGKGFDIKVSANDGKTVLHICCLNGQLDMCKYLVNTYPHLLDVKDKDGMNILHDAARGGNLAMLKFVLEKGFDIKTKRGDGKTVLHFCCSNGKLDMCKYLMENYSHLLYIKDSIGMNVLHSAAWGGNIDLFTLLLDKGFDIKTTGGDGKTVLHLCCMNGKLEMCGNFLIESPRRTKHTEKQLLAIAKDAVTEDPNPTLST
ncbi:CARD- and ANK-domain containing inflammasome adapter protein-like [Saccostrea echinata]|uniref:CARD- and ANK-domain containing inflammasome adapter protein-like n=1 Tax=Saccostrea echinata TaxID=191078 RepID=UPI002A8074E4|nr:CARD- and ANK-domain containing inflammasome adapter protein-like [Saccostrea echinata]